MKLSIVTTLYKSGNYIDEFYRRIIVSAERITLRDFEIIIVDDGSPDDSLSRSLSIAKLDSRVTVVELSRNFGHHKAMMTGLAYALGDYVLVIDSDLEEAPELLEVYWNHMNENIDADVVYGKLLKRKGFFWERTTGALFYRIMNLLSGENMPIDYAFSRLMKRNYVNNLLKFEERELWIGGLWFITGFKQIWIEVEKTCKGKSSYTFNRKMALFVNAITSFSVIPLQIIFYVGLLITLFSLAMIVLLSIRKVFYNDTLSGWTSIMVFVSFVSGIIMLSLGVVSIYLSKVYIEVKKRPYTIVKSVSSYLN